MRQKYEAGAISHEVSPKPRTMSARQGIDFYSNELQGNTFDLRRILADGHQPVHVHFPVGIPHPLVPEALTAQAQELLQTPVTMQRDVAVVELFRPFFQEKGFAGGVEFNIGYDEVSLYPRGNRWPTEQITALFPKVDFGPQFILANDAYVEAVENGGWDFTKPIEGPDMNLTLVEQGYELDITLGEQTQRNAQTITEAVSHSIMERSIGRFIHHKNPIDAYVLSPATQALFQTMHAARK